MSPIVSAWMRSTGLTVKTEFHLPWGVCDLVGVSLNADHVAHRLQLKQRKAIGSITSTAILLQIPDVETHRSLPIDTLYKQYSAVMPLTEIQEEVERLIAGRFVVKNRRGRLQKVNGWMPLEDRLIAVELKLSRVEEALVQARNHLDFATESYAAFPVCVAERIAGKSHRWSQFFDLGIGLISVGTRECHTLIPARNFPKPTDVAVRAFCVEKFWRTRTTGRSS